LHRESIEECWSNTNAYTKYIISEVFAATAKNLGPYAYLADYYTLDSIFYSEREETLQDGAYAKFLEVAIEHENYAPDAKREINKLHYSMCR